MKIGYVQFSPALGDLDANIRWIERLGTNFSDGGLYVLPELCNSGYNFDSKQQAQETSEPISNSRFISFLSDLCRRRNVHLVAGMNEREGDLLFNTAVLIGPDGLIGKYRKMHLFLNEKDYFAPGNVGLPVFKLDDATIGMLVCFDWIFPEVWRILALKGADIICHPSNLVLPGRAQKGVPAHAMMNRVFVVTANRIGTELDLTFTGNSLICDPSGEILLAATATEESVGAIEIDPSKARDKKVTPRNDIFGDRRPSDYRKLTE